MLNGFTLTKQRGLLNLTISTFILLRRVVVSLFRKIKHEPYIYRGLAFVCPKCNEYPGVHTALAAKAVRALYIPYFLCGECRLAHINADLVRARVKDWWQDQNKFLSGSLKHWQKRMLAYMRELQRYYTSSIGYRFLRKFKRTRPPAAK